MSNAKTPIMASVYTVWLFRRISRSLTAQAACVAAALWYLGAYYISYRDVLTNTSTAPSFILQVHYLFGAYTHTEITVQILLTITLVLCLLLGWHLGQGVWRNTAERFFVFL